MPGISYKHKRRQKNGFFLLMERNYSFIRSGIKNDCKGLWRCAEAHVPIPSIKLFISDLQTKKWLELTVDLCH